MTLLLVTILLLALLLAGIPVGFSMGIAGAVGLWLYGGDQALLGILSTSPYRQSASWLLVLLPMFVLMAEFMVNSGMARRLFDAAYQWFSWIPGNLAVATVLSSAVFGAVSGSSAAATATMGKTAIPEMKRYGYDNRLALGVVATAGGLAILIPPSVVLIVYGILTEVSIGQLFLAGVIPGILTAAVYVLVVVLWAKTNPAVVGKAKPTALGGSVPAAVGGSVPAAAGGAEPAVVTGTDGGAVPLGGHSVTTAGESSEGAGDLKPANLEVTWASRWASLVWVGPVLLLFILVMGGIYSGLVTITESSALGAGGALLIAIVSRTMDVKSFIGALTSTVKTTAMIFAIVIGAHIFGYYLTFTRTTVSVVTWIADLDVPRWTILAIFIVMYLLLGCVMDQLAILVLTVPLVFPVIMALDYSPVWFGIIMVKTVEIGLATPPMGMNVFIGSSVSGISLGEGFRGVGRFVAADLVVLLALAAFPDISLWLV